MEPLKICSQRLTFSLLGPKGLGIYESFSVKGQIVCIFSSDGHLVSIATTQLCYSSGKGPQAVGKGVGMATFVLSAVVCLSWLYNVSWVPLGHLNIHQIIIFPPSHRLDNKL